MRRYKTKLNFRNSMKKLLLSLLAVVVAFGVSVAEAEDTPGFKWHTSLYSGENGAASSSAIDIVKASDGNAIMFVTGGSTTTNHETTYYKDEAVMNGADTNGTSALNNSIVMKVDQSNGKKIWAIYTTAGDTNISASSITATNDGGAIVVFKERYSVGLPENSPAFVDATGNEFSFQGWATSSEINPYYLIVLKISGEGAITAGTLISADTTPEADATTYASGTPDGVYGNAVAVDDADNVYLAGRLAKILVFTNQANRIYVGPSPKNTIGWTGDSQKSVGDMFIAKFDSDLNFQRIYTSGNVATREQIDKMVYSDGKLYFAGNLKAPAGTTFTYGDQTFTVDNEFDNIVYGSFTTDLTPSVVKCIKATTNSKGSHTTQIKGVNVIDGTMYISGLVIGGFTDETEAHSIYNTTTMLGGFIIGVDAGTGDWTKAKVDENTIGGYFGICSLNGSLYTYRYQLSSGVYLEKLNSDLTTESTTQLVAGSGTTMSGGCSTGNAVLTLSRTKGAKIDETQYTFSAYGLLISSYDVVASGVESVDADSNAIMVEGQEGQVVINTTKNTDITITNVAGQTVYNSTVAAGKTVVELSAGAYLVGNKKVMVK